MAGSLFLGAGKRVLPGDRPGILSLPEDGDSPGGMNPVPDGYGFTVTQRASFAVTVMPQAVPLTFRG